MVFPVRSLQQKIQNSVTRFFINHKTRRGFHDSHHLLIIKLKLIKNEVRLKVEMSN
jgi:hypothetical protein